MSVSWHAATFMAAAARGQADPGQDPQTTAEVGRRLWRLVFGAQADLMAGADPQDRQPVAALEDRVDLALDDNPEMRAAAAGLMIAHYREEAEAGSIRALVSLGDLLWWDDPAGARAAFQRAAEAGHHPALLDLAGLCDARLDDVPTALAVYQQAAACGDPDVAAEALTRLGGLHAMHRDVPAARAAFQQAIATGHAEWAPAAMSDLGHLLQRLGEPGPARALYQQAIDSGNPRRAAEAGFCLGDLLKEQGDLAGARAAWQRVIESADADWAGPAMTSLVNLLREQDDADGLRDAYRAGLANGNPDALYALDAIGQHLAARGDIEGAHTAWQEAIEAGYEHADDLRELMDPPAGNPDDDIYPADLPAEFDPGHVTRAGVTVLERGLPALPATFSYQMAIPVAYWTADRCAVVLFLLFRRIGRGDRHPIALRVTYARGEQGWTPHGHAHGSRPDSRPSS